MFELIPSVPRQTICGDQFVQFLEEDVKLVQNGLVLDGKFLQTLKAILRGMALFHHREDLVQHFLREHAHSSLEPFFSGLKMIVVRRLW